MSVWSDAVRAVRLERVVRALRAGATMIAPRWWRRLWANRWYVPWWFVYWLDAQEIWCWADLVTWKVHASPWPRRLTTCVETVHDPTCGLGCYCGYWSHRRTTGTQ